MEKSGEQLRRRTGGWILWSALVGIAILLRIGPIFSGLPYSDYVDEGHLLHQVIGAFHGQGFDNVANGHPPLPSYLTAGAIAAYAPIYRLLHHRSLWSDLPSEEDFHTNLGEHYDLLSPPEIIALGRLVVACLSVGTVILAGALAHLLFGSRAGFLAMLFTALCPALVSRGAIIIIDTIAAFFALATLYFCERLRFFALSNKRAAWRNAAFAGIASGLACGAKYTIGLVFAAVLTTIVMLPVTKKSKVILAVIAGAGLGTGLCAGAPAVLFNPGTILAQLRGVASFYQTIHSDQGYGRAAVSGWELGFPLVITGVLGLTSMLGNASTWRAAASWLAFILLLLSAVVGSNFQPFRNVLPLVPLLCIGAAFLCARIYDHFEQRGDPRAFRAWLAPMTTLFLSLSLAWWSGRHLQLRTQHIDTRVRAIDWLQQHATKKETVLAIHELSILPAEWKRIAARATVIPWFQAADLLERERFYYVMTGDFDLRYASDPNAWSAYRERWQAKVSPLPVQADFGQVVTPVRPYLWRTNDERILILKGNAQR
jgi:hypothetical protein